MSERKVRKITHPPLHPHDRGFTDEEWAYFSRDVRRAFDEMMKQPKS